MRRSASEVISELETRIAKLERQASDDTDFYIEAIGDISRGLDDLSVLKSEKSINFDKSALNKILGIERELNKLSKSLEG
tara:strand:+ start:250 stop:489 length:240 start_codon:yes stop_codon:yes gene_type:complete